MREYTVKGIYAQMEIRAKFLLMKCPERGNMMEFLRGLRLKGEEYTVRKLVREKMVTGIRLEYTPFGRPFFCASCVYAEATWKLVAKMREGERADVFGGEVNSDVWGLAPVESKGGKRYYITFIDDKSCLTTLYLLRMKDEVPSVYKQYKAWVETKMGIKIKILNSD